MRKIVLLFFFGLLCACARQPQQPVVPEQDARAAAIWEAMQADSREAEKHPYRMKMSMRFGSEGDTRRVTGILWGNNEENLRLDVMAGVGAVIARIMEDRDLFLLYVPRDRKAYYHRGTNKPLLRVGVPLPFNLSQLAALLNGRYSPVFGTGYDFSKMEKDDAVFGLDSGAGGELVLNSSGHPVAWSQKNGWRLDISYGDENPPLPESLKLINADGKRAVILVKERETPDPFDKGQMTLEIPAGTAELPLSKYRP